MNLYYSYLKNCFAQATQKGYKFIGLMVQLEDLTEPEIIVVQRSNFDSKLAYIQETYDNNLRSRMNENIAIIGFTYDNTFEGLEQQLLGGERYVYRQNEA